MRNLKKILALVLALVMSLSLMATASAAGTAAATDAATAYKTAVDVLTGLKVVIGDAGGIRENDPITRAEAATLIYRVHTADVTDSKVYLHTDHPFTDVASTSWMNSYVSYAHNAQIVKGKTTTTFDPTANITGYETLAMTLRALGYGKNGEFEGGEWKIQTAAWSQRIGLFNGISAADSTDYALNQPASRGFVFQVMFNAVLMDQVAYSAYTPDGYSSIGTSMANGLKLTKVEGVVTANEYADLYDTTPLADGKTKLGEYTINYTTNFDDLGESKLAYLHDGKTVLTIADSGKNSKAESTDEEKNLTRILGEAGISTDSDTERFINFGQGSYWTSDWKVKYVLSLGTYTGSTTPGNDPDDMDTITGFINRAVKDRGLILPEATYVQSGTDAGKLAGDYSLVTAKDSNGKTVISLVYTREFSKNTKIGISDQTNIETIFDIADKTEDEGYITGEVYVGTTSRKDVSDEKSFDQFLDEYIDTTDEAVVSANERGNWLKVIDNDGDGKADYILKTIYTMAQVTRVKDDVITLDVKDRTLIDTNSNTTNDICPKDFMNILTSQPVTTKDDEDYTEPAAGDVVYYAIIDGNAFAYLADVEVATFEEVNRNTRVATTVDGTEWTESQICEHIVDEAYMSNITALAGKVSYDVYFDRGGYIAAFAKSEGNDFVLITDGWFNSTKTGYEYAVKVYNDAEDTQDVVDLTSGASKFISGNVLNRNNYVQNNDWNALKYLGGVSGTSANNDTLGALNGSTSRTENVVKTTVAAISGDSILPVDDASASGRYDRYMVDMKENKIPSSAWAEGNVYQTSSNSDTAYDAVRESDVEVRALSTTVYYVVYPTNSDFGTVGATSVGVKTWTGYGKVPSAIKSSMIEDVYAVATRHAADNDLGYANNYYTADIVVIELNCRYPGGEQVVFLVDDESSMSNVDRRPVRVIDKSGKELEDVYVTNKPASGDYYGQNRQVKTAGSTEDGSRNTTPKWYPGLYWLTETNVANEYTLRPLTIQEIIDEGFTFGYVQYEKVPSDVDWMTVIPATWDSGEDWLADPASGVKGTPFKISTDTLWTLGYGVEAYQDNNGSYWDYCRNAAEAETDTADVVFEARKDLVLYNSADLYRDTAGTDHSAVRGDYNYNRVMICGKDSSMSYAISFDNLVKGTDNDLDFARQVWDNLAYRVARLQANTTTDYTAPAVTFYGVENGETNKDLTATDADTDITVSYKTADDATAKTIVVTPVDGNAIERVTAEVVGGAAVTMNKVTVDGVTHYESSALTLSKGADTVYTVTVYYKADKDNITHDTWTLTQNKQNNTFGELAAKYDADDATNNPAGIQVVSTDVENDVAAVNVAWASGTLLSSLEEMLVTDKDGHDGTPVKLYVVDASGNRMPENWLDGHTVSELVNTGAKLYATIKNADGGTKDIKISVTGTNSTGTLYSFTDDAGITTTNAANDNVTLTTTAGEYYTITDEDGNYYDAAGASQGQTATYISGSTTSVKQPAASVTVTSGYHRVMRDDNVLVGYAVEGEDTAFEGFGWVAANYPNSFVAYSETAGGTIAGYFGVTVNVSAGDNSATVNITDMPSKDIYIPVVDTNSAGPIPQYYLGVKVDDSDEIAMYTRWSKKLDMSDLATAIGDNDTSYYRIKSDDASAKGGYEYIDNGSGKTAMNVSNTGAIYISADGYVHVETGFYSVTVTNANNVDDITASIKDNDADGTLGYTDSTLTNTHYVKGGETFVLTAGGTKFDVDLDTDVQVGADETYEVEITENTTIAVITGTKV